MPAIPPFREFTMPRGGLRVGSIKDESLGLGGILQRKLNLGKGAKLDTVDQPTKDWMVCHRVGPLTGAKRKALPKQAFGLPETRRYPMPDPSHARNAKGRAKQMLKKKKISQKDYDRIVRKANKVINKCKKGK